ncbi:alpha-amylase 3, chloroplastic [Magnolia sinica]|uniref:alpha-amylase 3, chloroplastic n=1 Tax=Magnolia sinica TaxID=86752 RepID=UPI0026587357|nr:alpha-amylase 3, chloroplastic [Magnolia sinica]
MSTIRLRPLLHQCRRENPSFRHESRRTKLSSGLNCGPKYYCYNNDSRKVFSDFCKFKPWSLHRIRAGSTEMAFVEADTTDRVLFKETFLLKGTQMVEGKVSIRLDPQEGGKNWQLTVGCNLPGKWVLHWGITYCGDVGSEWDQPPPEMRPLDSVPIKDYAIETPLKKSPASLEGHLFYEVQIDFSSESSIAAIHFVLKEEGTGAWYQHRGRDFRVPLINQLDDGNIVGDKKGFRLWPGALDQISTILLKPEGSRPKGEESVVDSKDAKQQNRRVEGFYEECSILKEEPTQNFVTVSVRNCDETDKNVVRFDTDLPGDVVVHWGVCRDDKKRWEIPAAPHPPQTNIFRKKALQTLLQRNENGSGSWGSFPLDKELVGLLFVLKLKEYIWMNNMGSDFYIPLMSEGSFSTQTSRIQEKDVSSDKTNLEGAGSSFQDIQERTVEANQAIPPGAFTEGIINEIRNLVSDISSGKSTKTKNKEDQEKILQEIEKLAAEAYSIFRSSSTIPFVEPVTEDETLEPPVKLCSGTGSGSEVLCQGFNWESHKSGSWYSILNEKATELSSIGFTVIWLPPPTDSVSPEGYMPRDLYNLNSRYGNMEELKILVKKFHEVGIKVLGDVVLNHRCAQYQNNNGVWNMFGGKLNWDDRAVVADDPHFQGRGNKSSGDNFHAAPNIDHSQDFVRKDLKEWLCWLRKGIGYDGWRLDFVRGFWGGYVKDYLDASEPYFAVGEYWDSLSYTYGEMEHNQDAHRQRIIDWINATNGTAGAFDVTTKGILHAALERCEYWRLSDQKGKPPGVLGWWPSRAVTFIENHDTGSTQGHWRFPSGKEMQGYAYILTHPGTPAVFYDHIFSHNGHEISELIALRNRKKIHCRSTVNIMKAERDVYAANIDGKVTVKIGPGYYEPPSDRQQWLLVLEGRDYKVWEAS